MTSNANSIAQLTTSQGTIEIELFDKLAPQSVESFIKFINHDAKKAFYRIVRATNDQGQPAIDVIQGGFTDDIVALPTIVLESTLVTGLSHKRGAISLARGGFNTGSGAHFFIVAKDSYGLDHGASRNQDKQGFAVFGQVIKGMDIIDAIHQLPEDLLEGEGYTKGQMISAPVEIISSIILK